MKPLPKDLHNLGDTRLTELESHLEGLNVNPEFRPYLIKMLACSDFIFQTCQRYPQISSYFLTLPTLSELSESPKFDHQDYENLPEIEITKALRIYRHWIMSVLAARDFFELQPIEKTMHQLSDLADEFYFIARSWVKQSLQPRWGCAINEVGEEVELIALGMGKLGGGELNFSSDIDLIFCYSEKGQTSTGRKQEDFQIYFTKLAQKIIQLLDNVTADGRVYRVDMRLRPFGDSGPLVSSFDAIEDYYQDQGRDWERYALLKARPLGKEKCSELELLQQQQLMQTLQPFVYRRYIDFSVIDSLRKMKRQIRQEVKRRNLQLNIKLGEGGIREAEFIVQALQMLRGGKSPELQTPSLLKSLPELNKLNVFTESEAELLKASYLWLRQCEQYLQAFADQQTQTLPENALDKQRLCYLFSCTDWTHFIQEYEQQCSIIHQLFNDVIGETEESKESSSEAEQLWFSLWLNGDIEEINSQHKPLGEYAIELKSELLKSVSGARGQEKLDVLMPLLLHEFASQQTQLADVESVIKLIKRIASRTTYLELLVENSGARNHLVKLMSSCHFIGQQLTKFPLLLDMLIDPKLLYSPAQITDYLPELRRQLLRVEPDDLELQMEVLRQFKLSNQLAISACDVEGVLDLMQVSDHLTALAEACLQQSVDLAWQQMVQRYGYPEGADADNKNFGVIGYGKLGGYELGYGSDLDIVFIHSCNSSKATSGNKAIDSRQFYLKLSQRIMHLFTTRTLSGELYEVDTRLRPSGASGLLAINIETFADYQHKEAWTWEHQALVRSRYILGDESLHERFAQIRAEILSKPREVKTLVKDIVDMRVKMFDNLAKESDGQFDLKQSRGGIADIEFISQYLVLANSGQHSALLSYPDNVRILKMAAAEKLISEQVQLDLTDAYINYRRQYHLASLNGESKTASVQDVEKNSRRVRDIWQQIFTQ